MWIGNKYHILPFSDWLAIPLCQIIKPTIRHIPEIIQITNVIVFIKEYAISQSFGATILA